MFYNATDGKIILGRGGGAASQHSYCTDFFLEDAQIGDLAVYEDDSHVGSVAEWNENGEILIAHCSARHNNVVITGKEGFAVVCKSTLS